MTLGVAQKMHFGIADRDGMQFKQMERHCPAPVLLSSRAQVTQSPVIKGREKPPVVCLLRTPARGLSKYSKPMDVLSQCVLGWIATQTVKGNRHCHSYLGIPVIATGKE